MTMEWTARWDAFERVVTQEPLFHRRDTLRAQLELGPSAPPRVIFVGIGVCGKHGLSRGLPVDAIGLLAAAEAMRKALGADAVVALVADRHAAAVGHPWAAVDPVATRVTDQLMAFREAADWTRHLWVVRAKNLHRHPTFVDTSTTLADAVGDLPTYARLQLADIVTLQKLSGGLLKVGWTLGGERGDGLRDERAFDELYLDRVGSDVRFAYVKAGRTLDPRRPHASPYVSRDPMARLLLDDETVIDKLANADPEAARGTRRHLSRVARAVKAHLLDVEGDVWTRVRALQRASTPSLRIMLQYSDELGSKPFA